MVAASFDIAGQNAADDFVDLADPRQVFQTDWPLIPAGIIDGGGTGYLGLLRFRPTVRTWRLSSFSTALNTASLTGDVEPDVRIVARLVGDDDFIAVRLGMDTDAPYQNMVVDFASVALSGADLAARYATWIDRAAGSSAQVTVALIDSTHAGFQSDSYVFDDGAGAQAATANAEFQTDFSVSATASVTILHTATSRSECVFSNRFQRCGGSKGKRSRATDCRSKRRIRVRFQCQCNRTHQ